MHSAYVTDIDVEIARRAIRSIGIIAVRHEFSANLAVDMLLSFFEIEIDYVTAETIIVIKGGAAGERGVVLMACQTFCGNILNTGRM